MTSKQYWNREIERIKSQGWGEVMITHPNARYAVKRPKAVHPDNRCKYRYVISPSSSGIWGKSRNDYVELI